MHRMCWRTVDKVGLSGALVWGLFLLYASFVAPWQDGSTSLQAQDSNPKPVASSQKRPGPPSPQPPSPQPPADPKSTGSKRDSAIQDSRKSTQPASTKENSPTPDEIVQSLTPTRPAPKLSSRQAAMLKMTAGERQRTFRDANDFAVESIKKCKEVFDRGLMPLPDFADQALAAVEIQLTVAALKGDRGGRVKALSEHLDLLKGAAKQLHDFNQPAAAGWDADNVYAKLLVSNAELRLAATRGDQAAYERAAEASHKLAEEQFALRLADFQSGQASLASLAKSASYLTTISGLPGGGKDPATGPTRYEEYLDTLNDVVVQTKKFADQGAGIGREDRLFQAQFELARAAGQAALQRRDLGQAAGEFDQAADAAKNWFDSQVKFAQTGTASMRDVTQAWWGRAELMDISERSGLIAGADLQRIQEADFAHLQKLVNATSDRQGRIAADVAYIKSLETLDNLWAWDRAIQATSAIKGSTGAKPAIKQTGGRVIELKPDSEDAANPKSVPGTTPSETKKSKNSPVEIVTPKRNRS